MLIKELLKLNENSIKVFGARFKGTRVLPQFTEDEDTAAVLAGYNDSYARAYPVELSFSKPAKNEDVEAVLTDLGRQDDLENSFAQLVAGEPEIRQSLADKGFDSYADLSVLENTEPMQYVVFSKSQAKYLS